MGQGLFKIIFLGDLVDEEKRGIVVRNLATLFGSTAGTLDSLFTRSPVLLKKNLTRDEAIRFRDAIVGCGAYCRVEAMSSGDAVPENIVAPDQGHADEQFKCPRCGEAQVRSPICRYCGALVQEYQAGAEVRGESGGESEEEFNRRYYERRQDLETAVNVDDDEERRKGRDRRRAHLNWRS